MSKSYFEQRIFGQNTPEAASEQAPETSVGAQPQPAPQQPAPSDAVPSQPYRFGAAARGEHPPIASQAYEDRVQQQEWSAAEELRSRIGMSHRERARLERPCAGSRHPTPIFRPKKRPTSGRSTPATRPIRTGRPSPTSHHRTSHHPRQPNHSLWSRPSVSTPLTPWTHTGRTLTMLRRPPPARRPAAWLTMMTKTPTPNSP